MSHPRLSRRSLLGPALAAISAVPALAQRDPLPFSIDDVLDVQRVSLQALSDDGRWAAAGRSSLRDRIGIDNRRYGDPTYVRPSRAELSIVDTASGETRRLFEHSEQVRGLSWSPDGARLAMLVRRGDGFELRVWERASGRSTTFEPPDGHAVAADASLQWLPDGARLVVAMRGADWARATRERFRALTEGPIIVHSSERPFLAWEALRRASLRKSLWLCDVDAGAFEQLLPELDLRSYQVSRDGSFLRYENDTTERTDYDVIFGSDARVELVPIGGGEARTIIESTKKRRARWSDDGRSYAFADEGDLFFATVDDAEPRRLTGEEKAADERPAGGDAAKARERFTPVRVSARGRRLVATSKKGFYVIDTTSGERALFLETPENDEAAPRYRVVGWSPDARHLYLSYASRTEWERGFVRYDVERRELHDFVKDRRLYSGFQLSRDGSTAVFLRADGNRPTDLYAADAILGGARRLTDANPILAHRTLSETELVDYLDADGNRLHGVLYYPADYVEGQRYPTIFLVYEQFFDDSFNGTINYLTSHGYALIRPSVKLETGHPGEAWLKGVTAAANALIERGIADPDRLGVHGTSYGGYATNLLIAQTARFKAAINISGKVNMISFYTDSPRLGVRNIHAPEKSQDRIGATLWEQPLKYLSHSAIMYADRIETPLLLISGDQDHNVPARQSMEMYYALRRLGKTVEWVRYVDGGHGTPTSTVEEVFDYHRRILGWYDRHLKPATGEARADDAVGTANGAARRAR